MILLYPHNWTIRIYSLQTIKKEDKIILINLALKQKNLLVVPVIKQSADFSSFPWDSIFSLPNLFKSLHLIKIIKFHFIF